jgi:hypothetical protein
MGRYLLFLVVVLSSILFHLMVTKELDKALEMKTALLRCVNGYTFPVTIDNKAFVIHCDSYDIGE